MRKPFCRRCEYVRTKTFINARKGPIMMGQRFAKMKFSVMHQVFFRRAHPLPNLTCIMTSDIGSIPHSSFSHWYCLGWNQNAFHIKANNICSKRKRWIHVHLWYDAWIGISDRCILLRPYHGKGITMLSETASSVYIVCNPNSNMHSFEILSMSWSAGTENK